MCEIVRRLRGEAGLGCTFENVEAQLDSASIQGDTPGQSGELELRCFSAAVPEGAPALVPECAVADTHLRGFGCLKLDAYLAHGYFRFGATHRPEVVATLFRPDLEEAADGFYFAADIAVAFSLAAADSGE